MENFKDKVVVITGASAGVGRATTREFARHKARVALLARGVEALEATAREVKHLGGEPLVIPTDVADPNEVEAAAQKIEDKWGAIDVWVNNAMVSVFCKFEDIKPEDFKRVTEVTYLGQVNGTYAALKRMKKRDHGSIVLVGSALAYRGIPLQTAYCGAKHAVQGFFDALRTELLHDQSNVSLSMVQLPALNTTQFGFVKTCLPKKPKPMGKIYQPEVAAEAIVLAAQGRRREIFVGASTYLTILGNKIAPAFADQTLAKSGIKGQLTNLKEDPDRKNNLWEAIPGDHGAHGHFDPEAKNKSWTLEITRTTGLDPVKCAGGLLLAALAIFLVRS